MRILMVTNQLPHPPIAGGRQRTQLIFRALQKWGQVDLFVIGEVGSLPEEHRVGLTRRFNLVGSASALKRGEYLPWRLIRRLRPGAVDRIAQIIGSCDISYRPDSGLARQLHKVASAGKYDIVVGRYLLPTIQSGAFDLGVPVVVDVDDLDTQVCQDRLSSAGGALWERPFLRSRLRELNQLVPTWLSRASHLWLSCPADLPMTEHRSVSVLPNIPFDATTIGSSIDQPRCPVEGTILVVGLLSWPPNSKGVEWFLRNVWPSILASGAHAKLRIVGAGLSPRLASRWRVIRGVTVVGCADDIGSEYRRAAVVIAPIVEGGGTKIKVIEALHNRCALVVTSRAVRGHSHLFRHGDSVLVADSPNLFADHVIRLLGDEELRNRLGLTGARIVLENLSTEILEAVVNRTIARLGVANDQRSSSAASV